MSAYVINSKGVCMTKEMREDREVTAKMQIPNRGEAHEWNVSGKIQTPTATTRGGASATTITGNRPLNTMDEMAYRELEAENNKLKNRVRAAEGETSIVKGIGINSPEMRAMQTENKNLKNLLGDANDKITVLQLRCNGYEIMRLKVLKSLQEMRDIIDEKENK